MHVSSSQWGQLSDVTCPRGAQTGVLSLTPCLLLDEQLLGAERAPARALVMRHCVVCEHHLSAKRLFTQTNAKGGAIFDERGCTIMGKL